MGYMPLIFHKIIYYLILHAYQPDSICQALFYCFYNILTIVVDENSPIL